jgi:hypothetical protein
MVGIYIVDLPTGTSGNITVNASGGNMSVCYLSVFAGYNMAGSTPDGIIESSSVNTDVALATVAGGFALAIGVNATASWSNITLGGVPFSYYQITGLNTWQVLPTNPSADSGTAWARAFGLVETTSVTMRHKLLNASGSPISATSESWVAASFH